MVDDGISARLALLEQHVGDLRETQPRNFEMYRSDKMLRRYIERMLHMAIDTCIQIGIGILTQEGYRSPENYHDVFIVLGEHGILPPALVDSMTALVEFRNVLVYEHAAVDDMMVYGLLKRRLEDFTAFARTICEFIANSASQDFPN